MIEAIILSTFSIIIGILVGALFGASLLEFRIKSVTLSNGNKIDMWKGFVDPTKTFVYTDRPDGDGVIFDEEGNIIFVDKHVR